MEAFISELIQSSNVQLTLPITLSVYDMLNPTLYVK